MGRFYNGDIEGKFWFAVQDSNDGEYFGAYEETTTTPYYVDDIDAVNEGLRLCRKNLKGFKKKIDEFFKEHDSYNNSILSKFLEVSEDKTQELLKQYARLELGLKIQKCILKDGSCRFDAEN